MRLFLLALKTLLRRKARTALIVTSILMTVLVTCVAVLMHATRAASTAVAGALRDG